MLTRLCCTIGIVDFRSGQSKFIGEWPEQDGADLALLAQSTEYIKCTLPVHTPAVDILNESGWVSFTSSMSFMWFTRSFVSVASVNYTYLVVEISQLRLEIMKGSLS